MKNNHLLGLFAIKNREENTTQDNTKAKYLKNPNKFSQKKTGQLHHFIKNEVTDILEELHNEHNQKQDPIDTFENYLAELCYSAGNELSSSNSDEELDLVSSDNESDSSNSSNSSNSNDENQLILSDNESEGEILLNRKIRIIPNYFLFNKKSAQTSDEEQDVEPDYRLI